VVDGAVDSPGCSREVWGCSGQAVLAGEGLAVRREVRGDPGGLLKSLG